MQERTTTLADSGQAKESRETSSTAAKQEWDKRQGTVNLELQQALVRRQQPQSSGLALGLRDNRAAVSIPDQVGKSSTSSTSAATRSTVPTQASSSSTSSTSAASSAVDKLPLESLFKQAITVEQVLTVKRDKPVCLLKIGGQKYILKAGKFGEMADHLTNTDLFNRLTLPGVSAPQAKEVAGPVRDLLKSKLLGLNLAGMTAVFDLPSALTAALAPDQQAMISTFAPGSAVSSFLDYLTPSLMRRLADAAGSTKSSKDAVQAFKRELLNQLDTSKQRTNASLLADLDNPGKRSQAIVQLKKNLSSSLQRTTLTWMEKVAAAKRPKDVVPEFEHSLQTLVATQKPLIDYVKSQDGAKALAAIMTMDLIDGMDDRLVKAFNGDNFYFDPASKLFWCIDNAKDFSTSLSFQDETVWQNFVRQRAWMMDDRTDSNTDKGKSLPELFHWMAYDRLQKDVFNLQHSAVLSPTEIQDTATAMQGAVTDTLQQLRNLVDDNANGLPKAVRDRLKGRLDFVDARNQLTSLLDFSDFTEVPTIQDPWFGKKLLRIVVRKAVGTTDEQTKALAWKELARDPAATGGQLEAQETEITQRVDKGQVEDAQRVFKALFVTQAALFAHALTDKTNQIGAVAALGKTNKAWGKFDPSVLGSVDQLAQKWRDSLKSDDDKDILALLNNAVDAFKQEFARQLI